MDGIIWNGHALVTYALFGVIWTVQLLVYPQFLEVSASRWNGYHDNHMRRITWVVGPLMLLEVASLFLLFMNGLLETSSLSLWVFGVGPLGLIWGVTGGVSVPLHGRLSAHHDPQTITRLIQTNWLRTLAWSLRGGWVFQVSM